MITYLDSGRKLPDNTYTNLIPDLTKRYWIGFNPGYFARLYEIMEIKPKYFGDELWATCDELSEINEVVEKLKSIHIEKAVIYDTVEKKDVKGEDMMSCSNDLGGFSVIRVIKIVSGVVMILTGLGAILCFIKLVLIR